eukprot:gene5831-8927_t
MEDVRARLAGSGAFAFVLMDNVDTPSVLKKLKSGALDTGVLACDVLLSRFHLQVAAQTAVNSHRREKMKTSNVNSEVLFALSPSRTISQAFSTFGPAPTAKQVLFARYYADASTDSTKDLTEYVKGLVEGDVVDIDRLSTYSDVDKIRK